MTEISRILALPEYAQGEHPPLPERLAHWEDHLWPTQVEALSVLASRPAPLGIYGDIGVGGGKFLIASLAGAAVGAKRPLVMTQPDLLRQAQSELELFRRIFPELDDNPPTYIPYSKLSNSKSTELLFNLQPDLIALDEAQAVSARDSARGLRLRNYVINNPSTRVVVLSGTLDPKKLDTVFDLAELSLREHMWLPVATEIQRVWSSLLDHKARPDKKMLKQYLDGLLRWAEKRGLEIPRRITRELYQKAYKLRYVSTPGVVAPAETQVDAELHMTMWRPDPGETILTALKELSETWTLPDGTEIVDALEYYRHAGTVSLGFYYKPIFEGDGDIEDWYEKRRLWQGQLRRQINYIKTPGLDSPANVVSAIENGGAHKDVAKAYWDWAAVRDTVAVKSETVWFDTSMVDKVAERARAMGRGIIWYETRAMQAALQERGFQTYGAGSHAPLPDVDLPALSRRVHGTGKNLQAWNDQLLVEPPSSANALEQLLGRTHRPGQLQDKVYATVVAPTWVARSRMHGAQAEADHVERTTNKVHKISFSHWKTCKDS